MRKVLVAAAAASILVLAGCSSDTDDAATSTPTAEATTAETPAATEAGTIVEVASATPDVSTLVAAVGAADLVETLSGTGPFTVFAPTNAAFEALPEGVLDALLLPENKDTLTKILTYHVVAGEVTSDAITAGDVPTLDEGQSVTVTTDGGVKVNGATVVTPDVDASNGVIHVIDAVLIPADVDPAALVK